MRQAEILMKCLSWVRDLGPEVVDVRAARILAIHAPGARSRHALQHRKLVPADELRLPCLGPCIGNVRAMIDLMLLAFKVSLDYGGQGWPLQLAQGSLLLIHKQAPLLHLLVVSLVREAGGLLRLEPSVATPRLHCSG